jgi:putative ATP-binding cassette transporter
LWDTGKGEVVHPSLDDMLFLPQRPYMIIGSLRAQLLYPRTSARDVTDERIHEALEAVNLPHLIDRSGGLDAEEDWGRILSLGEQQRVAFARALLTDRPYVILDEATSALDEENEAELYELLSQSKSSMISVTHRPHLARYHTKVLVLGSDETWELVSSTDYLGGLRKAGRTLSEIPEALRRRRPRATAT